MDLSYSSTLNQEIELTKPVHYGKCNEENITNPPEHVYGSEAAGVLVETDADDIQREIINAALEGKAFSNAGEAVENLSIFSTGTELEVQVTKSPMGSLIATSPILLPAWDLPSGKVYQLTLIPGFEPVPVEQMRWRKRRR